MITEPVEHGRFVQWRPWQGGAYRLYCVTCGEPAPVTTSDGRAWDVGGPPAHLGIWDRAEPS